ncbi:PknH-like extracellular domain-containing protein [Mycolicibacterium rutilum]|uniref:PknH-like extracellular domain-containing protein n=1 Tax=Mycolicibacterium rutilum TaxID=370526 RepID=A0A1H6LFD2_MYCRU|nr:sensor domain-containing protein [Mycolicibacterium rutilum]SEH87227.1 PknH-like extracellular domain-containing protein [Mycolicibacterium rutilum]
MPVEPRQLTLWCAVAALTASCSLAVEGHALRAVPGIDDDSLSPVDVETIMLDQAQMRAITGAGEHLTIIPSMDGKFPVDIDALAETTPPQCQWVFAETQTFGSEVEEFHKTTFQNPPKGGLISEGAAAYRDAPTARRAFDDLVARVDGCAATALGPMFVGDWVVGDEELQTRQANGCGRDYRVKSVVLVEVTACQFPDSVPGMIMVNILAKVPG